jgi:hypothetical protein
MAIRLLLGCFYASYSIGAAFASTSITAPLCIAIVTHGHN